MDEINSVLTRGIEPTALTCQRIKWQLINPIGMVHIVATDFNPSDIVVGIIHHVIHTDFNPSEMNEIKQKGVAAKECT